MCIFKMETPEIEATEKKRRLRGGGLPVSDVLNKFGR
jgi:hypothetical protein